MEICGSTGEYSGTIPPLSMVSLLDLHMMMSKIDSVAKTINADEPWKSPNAEALDNQTAWVRRIALCLFMLLTNDLFSRFVIKSYFSSICWTNGALKEIDIAWRVLSCTESSDTSALSMLHYVKTAGSLTDLIETTGGAQEMRFDGGTQPISTGLAKVIEAAGGKIVFNSPVTMRRFGLSNNKTPNRSETLNGPQTVLLCIANSNQARRRRRRRRAQRKRLRFAPRKYARKRH